MEDLVDCMRDELLIRALWQHVLSAITTLLEQRVLLFPEHLARTRNLCGRPRPKVFCVVVAERSQAPHELSVGGAQPGGDVVLLCEHYCVDGGEGGASGCELADSVLANFCAL